MIWSTTYQLESVFLLSSKSLALILIMSEISPLLLKHNSYYFGRHRLQCSFCFLLNVSFWPVRVSEAPTARHRGITNDRLQRGEVNQESTGHRIKQAAGMTEMPSQQENKDRKGKRIARGFGGVGGGGKQSHEVHTRRENMTPPRIPAWWTVPTD